MKWDAYHCTLDVPLQVVVDELSRLYYTADFRPIQGKTHGYDRISGWFLANEELARIYYGGNGGAVSLQVKGPGTPELVKRVRIVWPTQHRVSRADVAIDFEYPGAWDDLAGHALGLAEILGLDRMEIKGYGKGDTVYIGSRSSVCYVRVYQKGKELFGEHGNPDHVRVELEVKPGNKAGKERAALMDKDQFWGVSEFSVEMLRKLEGGCMPERVKLGSEWRDPDVERARRALIRQYWKTIEAWAIDAGGASRMLRQMDEYRRNDYGEGFTSVEALMDQGEGSA
jgi:hypothetical protein